MATRHPEVASRVLVWATKAGCHLTVYLGFLIQNVQSYGQMWYVYYLTTQPTTFYLIY